MNSRLFFFAGSVAIAVVAQAQPMQRRATIVGGGDRDRGKCTIEVVVDGAADIEIRGDSGVIRNQSGQRPEWRRFECSSPMPTNPMNFRFTGVDGRGRQQLISDPQNGGVAVIRIEDRSGGREGYTFDLTWSGGNGYPGGGGGAYPPGGGPVGPGGGFPGGGGPRGGRRQLNREEQACESAVVDRLQRDRYSRINVDTIDADPQGRQDWFTGVAQAARGPRVDYFNFSCSIDRRTFTIRSLRVKRRR